MSATPQPPRMQFQVLVYQVWEYLAQPGHPGSGGGFYRIDWFVPSVGDSMHLYGEVLYEDRDPFRVSGMWVVAHRKIGWSSWGSPNWPFLEPHPNVGPTVTLYMRQQTDLS